MRAVVQRVSRASVSVGDEVVGEIDEGMLVLLGVAEGDTAEQADALARKISALRIFEDDQGRMGEALGPDRGILCVSQFTLLADTRKGNRPSFTGAAPPDVAEPLYERFCELTGAERGRFGAMMQVDLINDGPVTLILEA